MNNKLNSKINTKERKVQKSNGKNVQVQYFSTRKKDSSVIKKRPVSRTSDNSKVK